MNQREMMRALQRQRLEQVRDPDVWLLHSHCKLIPGPRRCAEARAMARERLGRDDLVALPLPGCSNEDCTCTYEMRR